MSIHGINASAVTQYVILVQYANGDADIGFDAGGAGGIVAIGPTLPRCTSEPTSATDPMADVYSYVMQYIHDPPTPQLNPRAGDGVTGLDTYVGVAVPDDHSASRVGAAAPDGPLVLRLSCLLSWRAWPSLQLGSHNPNRRIPNSTDVGCTS